MRVLVDVNLSPTWCRLLRGEGWEAMHWSQVGAADDSDATIMHWAARRHCVVLTHDLDFGTILAAVGARSPSVIQLRAQDVMPEAMGAAVVAAIKAHRDSLEAGVLLVLDEGSTRARVLPIERDHP